VSIFNDLNQYQSGYLTIKEYDADFNEFVLGFPNEEVKQTFP
jgi:hypothetical protein